MRRWGALVALAVVVVTGACLFWLLERELVGVYAGSGPAPEVIATLEQSQAVLRRLAELDPANAEAYRRQFDSAQTLLNRMRILEHSRDTIVQRFQLVLLGIAGVVLLTAMAAVGVRQARDARRLGRLHLGVTALAQGEVDLDIRVSGRDAIGAAASMVEEASRVAARDRRRLAALQGLASWQEAARCLMHELRTPLASARLGLDRARLALASSEIGKVRTLLDDVRADIERLGELTGQFAGFAKLGPPRLERVELGEAVSHFVATFADAWASLQLRVQPATAPCPVSADRGLLRQVLANLCENAARAMGESGGTVRLVVHAVGRYVAVDVSDDGPGVPDALRDKLFEPYVTSAASGQGMGLGLAISRKIMLDHGGDLELVRSDAGGTVFRLVLPREEAL